MSANSIRTIERLERLFDRSTIFLVALAVFSAGAVLVIGA